VRLTRTLSSTLAVVLALSLPIETFAQHLAASHALTPTPPAASGAAAVQIIPSAASFSPALTGQTLTGALAAPSSNPELFINSSRDKFVNNFSKAQTSLDKPQALPLISPADSAKKDKPASPVTTPPATSIAPAKKSVGADDRALSPKSNTLSAHLDALFDNTGHFQELPKTAPAATKTALQPTAVKPLAAADAAYIKSLKAVLGDGVEVGASGLITPFKFHVGSEVVWARAAGLEGFLHRKLELERRYGKDALIGHWNDYFRYLNDLLRAAPWTADVRAKLAALRIAPDGIYDKNLALNSLLIDTVHDWQARLAKTDASSWDRQANIYMILARAFNQLRPGKNFFDSLDEQALARIKQETKANVLWLLDVFEIGEVKRWGSSGGSPYALKGYRFKPELGGEEGARRFIERAKKMGFRVGFDEIPNHTAIDSDQAEQHPQDFIHLLPPAQPQPGEDMELYTKNILNQVPQHIPGVFSPLYQLRPTMHYPGHEGKPFWILIHQPITDYGDAMWLDMLQRDYSRQSARDWEAAEMNRLFTTLGVSFARRDMAYYVVNAGYYSRWLYLLSKQKDGSSGWVRAELERFIEGFKARWAERKNSEFLAEMTDKVRAANPDAVFIDEAYGYSTDLSRAGSNGVYNKNDHDLRMGQVGLYDALVEAVFHGNVGRLKAALENVAFKIWQRGGAAAVNFSVTHDGGEGNPVDKFGKFFRAVVAMSMLFRPTLVYNGLELGVGQRRMLIGDLSQSQDLSKAIPFDVPALINWHSGDPVQQSFLHRIFAAGERNVELFQKGAMEVLDAVSATPLLAWSAAYTDPATHNQKALLVAANFSHQEAWTSFKMSARTSTEDLGAFRPRADRVYVFRDLANLDSQGQPRAYTHSGRSLLEQGLSVGLPSAGVHIFEVEETLPAIPRYAFMTPYGSTLYGSAMSASLLPKAPAQAPAAVAAKPGVEAKPQTSSWEKWTKWLINASLVPYFFLQIPQIIANFTNIFAGDFAKLAGLPWIGYSTGLLASFMLLSYFAGMKEKAPAFVQVMGIAMNLVVLGQLVFTGFMPMIAFAGVASLAGVGLVLNYLNVKGKLNPTLWTIWNSGTALMALAVIPPSIALSFGAVLAWAPATTAIVSWATGGVAFAAGLALLILDKMGKLSGKLKDVWSSMNAASATALYTINPLIGLTWLFLHPTSIAGISATTNVLNMLGSMFQLPRGLFLGQKLWIFGNLWAITVGSWVALAAMYWYGALGLALFGPITGVAAAYLAFVFWRNARR
jgi:hypothetical protein